MTEDKELQPENPTLVLGKAPIVKQAIVDYAERKLEDIANNPPNRATRRALRRAMRKKGSYRRK